MVANVRLPALTVSSARTIRFRLITLVLLVLLPLLMLFGWLAYDLARARMSLIEVERREAAEKISGDIDREVARTLGALMGLAASYQSKRDPEELKRHAATLASKIGLARIWSFDPTGATMTELDRPSVGSPPFTDTLLTRTLQGQSTVSQIIGVGLGEAVVLLAVPIADNGRIIGGIAAVMPVASINRVFNEVGLEAGWVAAIVDRGGRFVARSLDAAQRIGSTARPELGIAANSKDGTGTFENVTLEGTPMLNSFRRSTLTDWTTVVAVPTEMVYAPLRRNTLLVLLVGSAALLMTIATAVAYATRISDPVRNLGRVASALAKGQPPPQTRYPLAELDEVHRAIGAATAESAHLAALVNSSGDAIISMSLDGIIQTWNPAAERLFGYQAHEVIGQPKAILVPPDRTEEYRKQHARVTSGESIRIETVRLHRNRSPIPVSVDAAPIRRPDGTIIATSSILHDITERIADEEHRRFLMREIAHRSKNQLAIIQSIASQTARASRGSLEEFLARFRDRLQGLSASHDLLFNQNWRGAPLDEIVLSQIRVFVGDAHSAVSVSGPAIMLSAAAAEAIGLAIHELATNSAKYGALSVPAGKVEVTWCRSSTSPDDWELTWSETGGPPVKEPSVSGFGTQVIRRMVAMAVQGKAELEYRPSGAFWRLVFPSTAIRRHPDPRLEEPDAPIESEAREPERSASATDRSEPRHPA